MFSWKFRQYIYIFLTNIKSAPGHFSSAFFSSSFLLFSSLFSLFPSRRSKVSMSWAFRRSAENQWKISSFPPGHAQGQTGPAGLASLLPLPSLLASPPSSSSLTPLYAKQIKLDLQKKKILFSINPWNITRWLFFTMVCNSQLLAPSGALVFIMV